MRHLINTYIQADPAADLGQLGELSLTELIIQTGIHDAIAKKLNEKGKLSRNAIAEGIINNVRKTIIRDQLTDPMFYEQMSKLLDDLIQQSRADTEAYEEFLRKAEALVKRLAARQPDEGVPAVLHGRHEAAVLYNNLGSIPATTFKYPTADEDRAALALQIDLAVREHAPAGWYGDQAREAQVLNALYPILDRDRDATQAVFDIVKNQPGTALRKALRPMTQMGVYARPQARPRTGAGGLICNDFKHLAASAVSSVTCQTVPLGLNNCASWIRCSLSRILRHVSAQACSAARSSSSARTVIAT